MAIVLNALYCLCALLWFACSTASDPTCTADSCSLERDDSNLFQHKVHVAMNSNESDAGDEEADVSPKKCCKKHAWDSKCACKKLGCCKKGKTPECFEDACRAFDPPKCFVMYLMADNNLDGSIAGDLEELISNTDALSHPGFYPLVYIDRHSTGTQTPVEGLKAADGVTDVTFYSGLRYIEKNFATNQLQVVEELPEANSDNKTTIEKFLTWAFTRCKAWKPNANVMLTLSSHGSAWFGFGGDEQIHHDSLLLQDKSHVSLQRHQSFHRMIRNGDIKQAIEQAMDKVNPKIKKLDLLGFDACLMMTYNTMYLYGGITRWFIASQAIEPGHGWDYTKLDPSGGVKDTAVGIADAFALGMHGSSSHSFLPKTLAVLNTKDFDDFATSFDELALKLKDASQDTLRQIASAQLDSASFYTNAGGIDLGDFLEHAAVQCGTSCSNGVDNAIEVAKGKYHAMLTNGHAAFGPESIPPGTTGMNILFPVQPGKDWKVKYLFDVWFEGTYGFTAASDRKWMQFLKHFWDDYQCIDRSNGALNKNGKGCEFYDGSNCGRYFDDDDFIASKMCCKCIMKSLY